MGWKLSWREPTDQHSEKSWDTIVTPDVDAVPSPREGELVGLAPPNRAPSPQNWTINQWSIYLYFNVQPPCTNAKPPYWRLSGDGSVWMSPINPKSQENTQKNAKNNLLKNKEPKKTKYKLSGGPVFTFGLSSVKGGRFAPLPSVSYATGSK